jgi:hypothetical protein
MSIASELSRLQQAKSDLATSIENKGVTVPAATTLDGYAALVDSIPTGGSSISDEIKDNTYSLTPASQGYNNTYCAYKNFVNGKSYQVIMKCRSVPTGRLILYAYQGNANTPNVYMGEIAAGGQTKEFTYTHSQSATYARMGIYATVSGERTSAYNCVVYVKEVT